MKKLPPIWVLLGLTRATETLAIVGFRLGTEADARHLLAERSKEESYDECEVFNITLAAPKLRYQIELWLVGTGMSKEDAAEQVTVLARVLGEQFRRLRRK